MSGENKGSISAITKLKKQITDLIDSGETDPSVFRDLLSLAENIEKQIQTDSKPADAGIPGDIKSFLETEKKFMKAFYRAGLMMTISTVDDGTFLEVNDAFLEVSGFSREEIIGKKSVDMNFITTENRTRFRDELLKLGRVKDMRLELYNKSGRKMYTLFNGEIITIDNRPYLLAVMQDITQLVKTEEKLSEEKRRTEESEERYRLLTTLTFEGIIIHKDGVLIDCNPAFEKMSSYSREELLGKNLTEIFFDPFQRRELYAQMEKPYATPYEITAKSKDGKVIEVEIEAKEILWKNESLRVAAIRDITEKKKTAKAYYESEERYRELMENSPVGIYRTNSKGEAIFYNDKMAQILGFKDASGPGNNYKDLAAALYVDPERRKEFIQEMVQNGSVKDFEYEAKDKDGKHFWISMNARVSKTFPDGTFIIDGFAEDITLRKNAEKNLIESEARYQTFIQQATEGIYRMEMEKPIDTSLPIETQVDLIYEYAYMAECNPTMAAQYGIDSVDEFIGTKMEQFHQGKNHPVNRETNRRFVANGYKIINEETLEKRIDGNEVYLLNNSTGIIENGKLLRIWGTQYDISEKKYAEMALEQRVIALTQPLDDTENITFDDLFNLEEIQNIQNSFSDATGVASIITYPDGTPITTQSNFRRLCKDYVRKTELGRKNCFNSDAVVGRQNEKGPNIQRCGSSGLWDAGASISVGGKHIANWLIGQVRDESITEESMLEYARMLGADEEKFIEAFHEVPYMSREQFQKIADALFILSKELSLKAYQNIQQSRFIAERKKAEKELIEERNRAANILEGTNAGTWEWNIKSNEVNINDRYAEILGFPPDGFIVNYDELRKITHSDDLLGVTRAINKNLSGEENYYDFEYRIKHKNGNWIWVNARGRIVQWNEKSEPVLMSGTLIDITQRKQTEMKLQEVSRRFTMAAEAAEIGVWELDPQADRLFWDERMFKLYGVNPDNFSPSYSGFLEFIHPDDLEKLKKEVDSAQKGAGDLDTEFRIIQSEGAVKHIKAYATVEVDKKGKPVRLTGVNYDITRRIEIEEALRSARDLLETAIAQSPSGIIIADAPDAKIRITNSAALNIRKGNPEILTGIDFEKHSKNWQTFYLDGTPYPPAKLPLSRAILEGVTSQNAEVIIRDEDGYDHYVIANASPIRDSEGRITAGIVLFHDITERKEAEEELAESKNFFEQLYLQSATSTMLLDPEGYTLRVNPKFAELFGIDVKSFENKKYNIFEDKEAKRSGIHEHIRNVLKSKKPETWELEFDLSNASRQMKIPSTKSHRRWYYDTCYPILDAKQNVQFIVIQHEEITESKEAERALKESEEKFRSYVENAPYGIFVSDIDGKYLDVNEAGLAVTGYSKEEILNMTILDLLDEEDRPRGFEAHKQLLNKEKMEIEFPFFHKNGSKRYWRVKGAKLSENLYIGFVEDTTERMQMEKDLLAAKNRAEEADTLKTNLLLNMSHEVRTPINGIMGLSTLLADLTNDKRQLELFDKLKLSTKRLLKTFTTVIDYSQISTVLKEKDPEIITLKQCLEEIINEYKPLAANNNLSFNIVNKSGDNICYAANDALRQIFSHLIDNAVKFSRDGTIEISFESKNNQCLIQISDCGIGIDEKYHKQIFEEYRQVSEGMGRAYEGIGLGLTIAKQYVEELGGKIELESKLNKGTTFHITLPGTPGENNLPEEQLAAERISTDKPHVLIVEDNDINCEIIEMFLEDICISHSALDAVQALKLLDKNHFDLILMDINLGVGMNGIDLAKKIREMPEYQSIPMIAITGYVFRRDQKKFEEEGFNAFIGKPFEEEELVIAVKKILNMK